MAGAQDYPVTFGYKAQDGYYYGPNGLVGPYHRGNDREMPMRTPIIVNGVRLGLSGNKEYNPSYTIGPHLHTGAYRGAQDIDPTPYEFNAVGAKVIKAGYLGQNEGDGVVLQGTDGINRWYLHMDRVDATIGQVIGGQDVATDQQIDQWISTQHQIAFGKPPSDAIFNDWRPVLKNNFVDGSLSLLAGIDSNAGALKNQPPTPPSNYEPVPYPVFKEK